MTNPEKKRPERHPIVTKDREGYYVIAGHMLRVTGTKGAAGSKSAQLSDGADIENLARLLLAELAGRKD